MGFRRGLAISLLLLLAFARGEASSGADEWWDPRWPYRIPATVDTAGLSGDAYIAAASPDLGAALASLGARGILDETSIRVVEYNAEGKAIGEVPSEARYSIALDDMEDLQIGWHPSGSCWADGSGSGNGLEISDNTDPVYVKEGAHSVRGRFAIGPAGSYPWPAMQFQFREPATTDWNGYELFTASVYPDPQTDLGHVAPDFFEMAFYNEIGPEGTYYKFDADTPALAPNRWNLVCVNLDVTRPHVPPYWGIPLDFDHDLGYMGRVDFFLCHDDSDGDGELNRFGGYRPGDVLDLYFDDIRLVDQNKGTVRWLVDDVQARPATRRYYIYFNVVEQGPMAEPPAAGRPPEGTPDLPTGRVSLGGAEWGGQAYVVAEGGGVTLWTTNVPLKVFRDQAIPAESRPAIEIAAARNEFEPFQLVVRPEGALDDVTVSISDFVGGVHAIPAANVEIALVEYVTTAEVFDALGRMESYPDPLPPLADVLAEGPLDLGQGQNHPFGFTLYVPEGTPAGVYTATIAVNPGGLTVPVRLEVWDFTLPRELHLKSAFGVDWDGALADWHSAGDAEGVNEGNSPDGIMWHYKEDFVKHRVTPWYSTWPAGPGDGSYFDAYEETYLRGMHGFWNGVGFPTAVVWPPEHQAEAQAWTADLKRRGILGKVRVQAWPDEPGPDDYDAVNENAAKVHPPRGADEPVSASGDIIRVFVTEQPEPEMYGYVDMWMMELSLWDETRAAARRALGEEAWFYVCTGPKPAFPNFFIPHPALEPRMLPWLAYASQADGIGYWTTTWWNQRDAEHPYRNPWEDPLSREHGHKLGNGDGTLLYPPYAHRSGTPPFDDEKIRSGPVASIRWEMLREGMEDYEYLWLLGKVGDDCAAQAVASRTVYERNPAALLALRAEMAEKIVQLQRGLRKVYLPLVTKAWGSKE